MVQTCESSRYSRCLQPMPGGHARTDLGWWCFVHHGGPDSKAGRAWTKCLARMKIVVFTRIRPVSTSNSVYKKNHSWKLRCFYHIWHLVSRRCHVLTILLGSKGQPTALLHSLWRIASSAASPADVVGHCGALVWSRHHEQRRIGGHLGGPVHQALGRRHGMDSWCCGRSGEALGLPGSHCDLWIWGVQLHWNKEYQGQSGHRQGLPFGQSLFWLRVYGHHGCLGYCCVKLIQ